MIISLNLPELAPPGAFQALSQRLQYELVQNIAESARLKWIRLAGQGLTTSRRDYIAGIQEVQMRQGIATVALVGMLPNLIEKGQAAYDMHDTLLGPNVPVAPVGRRGKHPKKDGSGFYRAIPFRHATPNTTGAVGAAMGSQYAGHKAFASPMGFGGQGGAPIFDHKTLGAGVYAQAKKLKATRGQPGGKVQYGGRLAAGLAPKLKEHHATDIFAGMIKSKKQYVKADQSQYTTFRTISTGSPGWMRPATQGKNYVEQVRAYVAQMAPRTIKSYLEKATVG